MERETCGRCGRKLTTEKSRVTGYGPVCHLKVLAADEAPEGQMEIDDNGEVVE